jgi:hypothetical protein
MPNTAYGTYRDGRVFFGTPAPAVEESRVRVTFLGEKTGGNTLTDIFGVLGPWEDDRDTEKIIAEIHNARVSKTDVRL